MHIVYDWGAIVKRERKREENSWKIVANLRFAVIFWFVENGLRYYGRWADEQRKKFSSHHVDAIHINGDVKVSPQIDRQADRQTLLDNRNDLFISSRRVFYLLMK